MLTPELSLPILATAALGAALFLPVREEARRRRTSPEPGQPTISLQSLPVPTDYPARPTFRETLSTGSDWERMLAIDSLAQLGDHAALREALGDRVDALAARAAFACLGRAGRDAYRALLIEHAGAGRCEAVLALLAAVID